LQEVTSFWTTLHDAKGFEDIPDQVSSSTMLRKKKQLTPLGNSI